MRIFQQQQQRFTADPWIVFGESTGAGPSSFAQRKRHEMSTQHSKAAVAVVATSTIGRAENHYRSKAKAAEKRKGAG